MNSKVEMYLVINGKKEPFKQSWDNDTTFNDLSEFIVDKEGLDTGTTYSFYGSADKKKKYDLAKTFKQENLKQGITLYAFEDGIIEMFSVTIVMPPSDPLIIEMPIDATFNEMSDHLIELKKENRTQISYNFFKDEQRTQSYDPKNSLKKENIINKQVVYATQQSLIGEGGKS